MVEILSHAVNPAKLLERFSDPGHGGQAVFFGVVRNRNHGRKVVAVQYECHPIIAKKEIEKIVSEARQKWGETIQAIVEHGTGRLKVGEVSVGIAVGSAHREEAFSACRYIIEELKVRVPIWKKEEYTDGESEWLKGHELCRDHTGGRKELAHGAIESTP